MQERVEDGVQVTDFLGEIQQERQQQQHAA